MISCIKNGKKAAQKAKARQASKPEVRFCNIKQKKVTVLVNYPEYVDSRHKGRVGDVYCECILECYRDSVQCRYSGITPLYPDPFSPATRPETKEAKQDLP